MDISFNEAIEAMKNNRQTLSTEIAKHDKSTVDFLHLIEFGTAFPDDIILEIHKRFSEALRKRRVYKNQLALLQSIEHKETKQRIYNPRILENEFIQYREFLKMG